MTSIIDTQAFLDAMNNPTVNDAMKKLLGSASAEVKAELADTQLELPLDAKPLEAVPTAPVVLPDFNKLAELLVAYVIARGQTTYSHETVKRVLSNMWLGKSAFDLGETS